MRSSFEPVVVRLTRSVIAAFAGVGRWSKPIATGRCALTTYSSGVTKPCTTASPRPQLALITNSSVAVVIGFAVNITPDTSASIITCTTTAMRIAATSLSPCFSRYAAARAVHSDAQHQCTASTTPAWPWMCRKVSCSPANDASAKSSAVPEYRTATNGSPPRAA